MRLVVAALLLAGGLGQPAPQPALTGSPSVAPGRLVTVDLTVTDRRGQQVTDLKAADFELREGTTPLPLESVRLVRVPPAVLPDPPTAIQSAADEQLAARQEQARLFAIFLDEY